MFRWSLFRAIVLLLLISLIGLQYRLWFGEANLRDVQALQQEIVRQRAENDLLVNRNHQLDAEVKDLKQGLAALEERARNQLGMVKEGESFFQLVPALPNKPPADTGQ
ncbi:cell division protein FtsB [Amphritea sp. 1_MG-2023]|uniref:cell division protein FtsB n=1 Tax=Amphritea sp. 1_MG-2023 TaxID=3062670 RepID=UPI0026E35590|nr:cell division protein FtsB [Amphritea sp. 1_MG-2023]MDO6562622.1 cell division protein FtsB [Amphritea sp. 1_MG-2023]